jgi:hypothetical protein
MNPRRPLRVLGIGGWVPWLFVRRGFSHGEWWTTYVLDFYGELEDFGEV